MFTTHNYRSFNMQTCRSTEITVPVDLHMTVHWNKGKQVKRIAVYSKNIPLEDVLNLNDWEGMKNMVGLEKALFIYKYENNQLINSML